MTDGSLNTDQTQGLGVDPYQIKWTWSGSTIFSCLNTPFVCLFDIIFVVYLVNFYVTASVLFLLYDMFNLILQFFSFSFLFICIDFLHPIYIKEFKFFP